MVLLLVDLCVALWLHVTGLVLDFGICPVRCLTAVLGGSCIALKSPCLEKKGLVALFLFDLWFNTFFFRLKRDNFLFA